MKPPHLPGQASARIAERNMLRSAICLNPIIEDPTIERSRLTANYSLSVKSRDNYGRIIPALQRFGLKSGGSSMPSWDPPLSSNSLIGRKFRPRPIKPWNRYETRSMS